MNAIVGIRPYVGGIGTWSETADAPECSDPEVQCQVGARSALIGAALRLAAPTPWVAPYFQLGAGAWT
ncbi:MAG: hypothetical protein AB7K71_22815 [Polyangiaceae bacterium]